MRQELPIFAAGANECVGGYPIRIRLLISLEFSVNLVHFTSRIINGLAGALYTGLWCLRSIDRLRSAQGSILLGT